MATDITAPPTEVPSLCAGDRMTRDEFKRRCEVLPEEETKHAELIEGIVYMPALSRKHGIPHFGLVTWLGMYQLLTPGTEGADNTSVEFDDNNMPQPDALLCILPSHGGRSRVTRDNYYEGGPELVLEIANTSADDDLGPKRELYRRFGVPEYIVWRVADRVLEWFALRNGYYLPLVPGRDGVVRSEVFPGLWLDPVAVLAGDAARVLAVAQSGHGSPEHTAFVAELRRRAGVPGGA